jgi:hypothetical protein
MEEWFNINHFLVFVASFLFLCAGYTRNRGHVLYHKRLRGDEDGPEAHFLGYFIGRVDQINKRSVKLYKSVG